MHSVGAIVVLTMSAHARIRDGGSAGLTLYPRQAHVTMPLMVTCDVPTVWRTSSLSQWTILKDPEPSARTVSVIALVDGVEDGVHSGARAPDSLHGHADQ